MLTKRIIACLDIRDGRTVKGTNFVGIKDAGCPLELSEKYVREGIDELVFLDITATHEGRKTLPELVSRIASRINIPFTVGGGISSVDDVARLLDNGADKISINSSAFREPKLIGAIASRFGSQCVVVAIDGRCENEDWNVYLNGGRVATDTDLFEWAYRAQECGAGEILFTSMDHDGVRTGYACDALARLASQLSIPVIASGGAGCKEDFREVFERGKADAALAAGIFHFGEIRIPELKTYLSGTGISVRTC